MLYPEQNNRLDGVPSRFACLSSVPPPSIDGLPIEVGVFVTLFGLTSANASHLNGKTGEVVNGGPSLDEASGRIAVRVPLDGQNVVSVRVANVRHVDDANDAEAQRANELAEEAAECLRRVREEGAGREATVQAQEVLAQAVALDPRCVKAHRVRGDINHFFRTQLL